jgi:hypothetical protein
LLENDTFMKGTDDIGDNEPVSCKWVFKKKLNHDGSIRYKARLVFRGFEQTAGVDYDAQEIFQLNALLVFWVVFLLKKGKRPSLIFRVCH